MVSVIIREAAMAGKTKVQRFNDLVDKIRKKLKAIEEAYPDSVVLERYRGRYRKLSEKVPYRPRAVDKALKEIKEVAESDELSLDGFRRSRALGIQSLNDAGLDYINDKNFDSFIRFLNDAQARGLGALYSSAQIIEAIYQAKKQGLTKGQINENIRRWSEKAVKHDKEGKVIEVVNPPELKVTKVRVLHPDRRRKRKK